MIDSPNFNQIDCPLKFGKLMWPDVNFYDKQRETVLSVREYKETYVTAGNQLGKDYDGGFIALSFFMRPWMYFDREYVMSIEAQRSKYNPHPHTRRVITTSVKDDHLRVLWGEIGRFATTCRFPIVWDAKKNPTGPLVLNHHEIRLLREAEAKNPVNYLLGQVSLKGEGMAGHHAAYTLCICDEASGVDEVVYKMQQGWAKRLLAFGNPNECQGWWRNAVDEHDGILV